MSIAWPERPDAKPTLRLRVLSLSIAGLVCASVSYLAVTQRFGAIAELIDTGDAIETIVEQPDPPPRPPPLVRPVEPPPIAPMSAPIDTSAPPMPFLAPVAPDPPAPPSNPVLTNATFLERPNARDFARYFPDRALARGQTGRVILDCLVGATGRLSCQVESESPAGWGFGAASLRAAEHFRVAPATADGQPTSEGRLRVPMTWRAQ